MLGHWKKIQKHPGGGGWMVLSVTVTVGCFERKLRSVTDSYIMYTHTGGWYSIGASIVSRVEHFWWTNILDSHKIHKLKSAFEYQKLVWTLFLL